VDASRNHRYYLTFGCLVPICLIGARYSRSRSGSLCGLSRPLPSPSGPRRLVFIEGLPKSGKTTTADWIATQLAAFGPTVWHEADADHPIAIGWPKDGPRAIHSCAAARYPFSDWSAFVRDCVGVQVMEARLCQNAACFALLAGDDETTATSVSLDIARLVAALNPLVVYLRVADRDAHTSRVIEKYDAAARAFLISTFDRQPWLIERGLSGEEGFATAIRSWACLADRVMSEAAEVPGVEILVVEGPERDWPAAREQIRRALLGV
jgi:hypothetical protein